MAFQHTCQKCGQRFGKIFSLTIHKIVIHNQPKIKLERIDDHKLNVSSIFAMVINFNNCNAAKTKNLFHVY